MHKPFPGIQSILILTYMHDTATQGCRNDKKAKGANAYQRGTSIDPGEEINLL
jgi:hypothetical protein